MNDKAKAAAENIVRGYERMSELLPLAGGVAQPIGQSTDNAVVVALAYLADHPEPVEANEKLAAAMRNSGVKESEGTAEELAMCARMLDTYAPELLPANYRGQIHFARAMMESTADTIRAFLAKATGPTAA